MAEGALSGGTLRGCTCLKCTNKADGERVFHRIRRTHRTFWQRSASHRLHGCAQIRRVWHPAIPTPPITQPNHLRKSVKSVGEYYHAGAAASAAPTKQTERVFPQNTRNTQNILAEKYLPQIGTDAHRLGGNGIPAIPTPPTTQPNHLWKSVEIRGIILPRWCSCLCSTNKANR